MMHYIVALLLTLHMGNDPIAGSRENQLMLDAVNQLRSKGCYCGRRYMPAVPLLRWNDTLYMSAMNHAMEMHDFEFFCPLFQRWKNIGERLDGFEYPWQFAGENLGEGQTSFDEVLGDWLDSKSHCRMLMNPNMKEMAVADIKITGSSTLEQNYLQVPKKTRY